MELQEATQLLDGCVREGVKDPWIGDSEQGWWRGDEHIAEGYFNLGEDRVTFLSDGAVFIGDDARKLKFCGTPGHPTISATA